MSMDVIHSNDPARLAGRLAEDLARPLADPFAPETLVVQSLGMRRWLWYRLADARGIAANLRFRFPNDLLTDLARALLPAAPENDPDDPRVLAWRLMPLLADSRHPTVRHYLADDEDGRKRQQLASRVADLFDQYVVYRPEMVAAWEAGAEPDDWQAELWRRGAADGRRHRGQLRADVLAALRQRGPGAAVRERLSIFGIGSLPPFHLELYAALARHLELRFYLLSAADVRPEMGPASGNRLFAGLGHQQREFRQVLSQCAPEARHHGAWQDERPETDGSLLAFLRRGLRLDRDRPGDGKHPVQPDDDSLSIHACHSPMREIQVLRQWLLARFQEDRTLTPRDVLVICPRIDAYAPFVHAVFGEASQPERQIAYSIADRGASGQGGIVDNFLALLALPRQRLGSLTLMQFLDTAAVRDRFGIADGDLGTLREWLRDAGVCWGLPDDPGVSDRHHWQHGLDRLLLGYAMVEDPDRDFADRCPVQTPVDGDLLGPFLDFCATVFAFRSDAAQRRDLRAWRRRLDQLIDDLYQDSLANQRELRELRAAVAELEAGAAAGCDELLDLAVPRQALAARLGGAGGHGFLSRGVCFCGMVPMRSLPFRIICMLGMDDGVVPRRDPQLAFDRMRTEPRPGDRSRRQDDRAIFLETLLCARERLYLSYVGQDQRDGASLPPSVLVGELLDHLQATGEWPPGETAESRLLRREKLQAYHPDHFRADAPAPNFSARDFACAQALLDEPAVPVFCADPLPPPEEEARRVDFASLDRFFKNPCRGFLQQRLRIAQADEEAELREREPWAIDSLTAYLLKAERIADHLAGRPDRSLARARGRGLLPPNIPGDVAYEKHIAAVADPLAATVAEFGAANLDHRDVELRVGPFELVGRIDGLTPEHRLFFRPGGVRGEHLLACWLRHLALNALPDPDLPRTTIIIGGKDKVTTQTLPPVADPEPVLATLLDIYWQGLTRPLPYFRNAADKYAKGIKNGHEKALGAAQAAYGPPGYGDAYLFDCTDPAAQRCFGEHYRLGDEFAALVEAILLPVHAQLGEGAP